MKAKILMLATIASTFAEKYVPIKFDSKLIQSLDGVARTLDGTAIKAQYQVSSKVTELQFGQLEGSVRIGIIDYKDKKLNLKQLLSEERNLVKSLQENGIQNNLIDIYKKPQLAGKLKKEAEDLKQALDNAKELFIEKTFIFLDSIQHFKGPIVRLMEEFCQKRNLQDSLLLEWANVNGNERDSLNQAAPTIWHFDRFCSDLRLFLMDLIHNCPKAKKQFEEWYLHKN